MINFQHLPTEMVHRIFDYCDTQTLLFSIRLTSQQLSRYIDSYNRFKLHVKSKSRLNVAVLLRLINPERITMLTIEDERDVNMASFSLDINRFSWLRSISLDNQSTEQSHYILQQLTSVSITSLSIDCSHTNPIQISSLVSTIINKIQLKELHLHHFNYQIQSIEWPDNYRLQCLELGTCTIGDYFEILHRLQHLRIFRMKCSTVKLYGIIMSPKITIGNMAKLHSLTIYDYALTSTDLELMLTVTPFLVDLRLYNLCKVKYDHNITGEYLEKLIKTMLPSLKRLEFFLCTTAENQTKPALEAVMHSFQTPFWIEEKHWLVNCIYLPDYNSICIYVNTFDWHKILYEVEYIVSSKDGVHYLSEVSPKVDTHENQRQVCGKKALRSIQLLLSLVM